MVTLQEVKNANQMWFDEGNASFFGDKWYKVKHGKSTGNPYLVRYTAAWTDMFGQPKKYHYRINPINSDTLKIESLIDTVFDTEEEVNDWLKGN